MKQIILLFSSLLFVSCSCTSYSKWDNEAADLKGKKILLFTKNGEGYIHDNIDASIEMMFDLGKKEGFTVDATTNSSIFAEEQLKQYDAVVFSNTNNVVFDTEAERDGFVKYIRSGKGFVGIHSACGTERSWTWFKQMIGCTFDFHPPFQPFTVKAVDNSHPSTKEIPEVWTVKDEFYIMKEMNPTVRILMVSDFSSPDFILSNPMPNTFGTVFPCVWCNDFDGGRQWFTSLGHDKSDYSNPIYVSHILGGLKWVIK